ncbi:MAG: TatD family hydrolase [Aigarchaeota archaeon]|jgi:TatD DNase family protein|nr:TatD family hydrolase [Candidatus Wolframiiraptor gerlachensis]
MASSVYETALLVDVHCHLTAREFEGRVSRVVGEAVETGVAVIITSGLGYQDALRALEISDYTRIYPSIGIAPYELEGYEDVLGLIERERSRIVAVGEVGLDYWRGNRDQRALQQMVFEEFIDLAKSLDLPIIVHSRSAGRYALEILVRKRAERVVMHAFDGNASYAARAASRGYMFSIPPSIARSRQKQKLVEKLPLENLLLESDAPVLAPSRDEVNHPRNVKVSAEWISRIKGISLEEVEDKTTRNALELFRLKV